MKNLNLRLLTVATLALISIAACKKSKDSGSSGLSATINGTSYQPSIVVGTSDADFVTIDGFQIQSGDSLWLSIDIPDTAHVNNPIDLDAGGITYTKMKSQTAYVDIYDAHGNITLSSFDKTGKKIAGKFSGVLYSAMNGKDSIVITNGQFNTSYK